MQGSMRQNIRILYGGGLNMNTITESIQNETDLINKYNTLNKKHLKKGSQLSDLSDIELFIWIAGKTYKYGRSFQDSINNAAAHIKNRPRAEKLFGITESDLLGFKV